MSSEAAFEKERDGILSEISITLNDVVNNLDTLNRNMETVLQVGKSIQDISSAWSTFYFKVATKPT
eukprot:ANDGO_03220.mRNA.1 DASH complex subunit DAD1